MIRHDKPKRRKSNRKNQDETLTDEQQLKVEQIRQAIAKKGDKGNNIPENAEIR